MCVYTLTMTTYTMFITATIITFFTIRLSMRFFQICVRFAAESYLGLGNLNLDSMSCTMESENSKDEEYTFVVTYMGRQNMYVQKGIVVVVVVVVVRPLTINVL